MRKGFLVLLIGFCTQLLADDLPKNQNDDHNNINQKKTFSFNKGINFIKSFFYSESEISEENNVKEEISLPQIPSKIGNAKTVVDTKNKKFVYKIPDDKMRMFQGFYIKELYKVVLNRKIRKEEFSKWLNAFDQGASRDAVYRALVNGREYREKQYENDLPSKAATNFVVGILNELLKKKIVSTKVAKMNFFTLKKLCVEKILDNVEVLIDEKYQYYNWYALFSKYTAENFQGMWSLNHRKNKDPAFHKTWAEEVPFDVSKSEIIIKIHRIMNSVSS